MIVDVPAPADFRASGEELLNVAWGLVMELYYHLSEAGDLGRHPDPEEMERFWNAGGRTVATALVLTHQASDSLLQAAVAEVSPYLLIAGAAREWPRQCHKENKSFSDFRTHDSQDLPRVHDTVASVRLNQQYLVVLDELRRTRNRAVHTVDPGLEIEPVRVLRFILSIAHEMLDRKWTVIRGRYLENYPLSILHSSDHVDEWQLPFEISRAVDLLKPADVRLFFEIDKKQRRYLCQKCTKDTDWHTALLVPNEADATRVRCFVCGTEEDVVRSDCQGGDCQGNVLANGRCLTCGSVG